MSYVETVAEEIFALSKKSDWHHTLQEQLSYHREYFSSAHYETSGYFRNVTPDIAELLVKLNPGLRGSQHDQS